MMRRNFGTLDFACLQGHLGLKHPVDCDGIFAFLSIEKCRVTRFKALARLREVGIKQQAAGIDPASGNSPSNSRHEAATATQNQ